MKLTTLALSLSVLSLTAFADNTLRSKPIIKSICDAVNVETYRSVTNFSVTKCEAGKFTIIASTRDPRTSKVTMMDVAYSMTMSTATVSGKAQVVLSISPDRAGRMVETWSTRSTKSVVNVSGDVIALIQGLVNDDEYEIDTHNGDYEMSKRPGYTLAMAKKDLLEQLPNDSCTFETYEGIDSTLSDEYLERSVGTDLLTLLQQAKRQNKIKAAVHRVYEEGESEYCSRYNYIIIFTDGSVFSVNLDLTT